MRKILELLFPFLQHKHNWEKLNNNPYKRICKDCGREEWLFEKRFPSIGEAQYEWHVMRSPFKQRGT
jgi:hypothetical protein